MFERWIFRWVYVLLRRRHGKPYEINGVKICILSEEGCDWFYKNFPNRIK